ncbi:hypothetical protein CJF30_00006991 [Rutstroemia sp. NJR-2017a BBW]|nr:hypothetical protein CJF30_00006991 [Rutstroemia sp. NJR-2017a BBW]
MASRRSIYSNNAIHMSIPNVSSNRELHVNCPAGCRILILNCMVDGFPDYTKCNRWDMVSFSRNRHAYVRGTW